MRDYRYDRLTDAALLRELAARISRDRVTTADLVALIAEVDARRLYVPAGYSSMHAYCLGELRLSDDEAYKRITVARTARRFPALFSALAEGRLHLTAVCALAPHLTQENLAELVNAATHRRRAEIEEFLAWRFPARISAPGPSGSERQSVLLPDLAPERVETFAPRLDPERAGREEAALAPEGALEGAPGGDGPLAPERVDALEVQAAQRAIERLVQLTVRKSTHQRLCYAQALLSHSIPSGDVSDILDRALDLLIAKAERRRIGSRRSRAGLGRQRAATGGPEPSAATGGPEPSAATGGPEPSVATGGPEPPTAAAPARSDRATTRYIPSRVRRAVWERDQGRCTFLGPKGNRCGSVRFLEFDHVDPYARGGRPTVEGLRLRCSAHNQFEALRVFGAEFIRRKRRQSRIASMKARAHRSASGGEGDRGEARSSGSEAETPIGAS